MYYISHIIVYLRIIFFMNVLYISYDGMTDPLGQSQVLPYLAGLSKNGFEIHILSCEKPQAFAKNKALIETITSEKKIQWHPIPYHAKPPVVSTLRDVYLLKKKAKYIIKKHQIQLIHCRSYISALVGLWAKKKFDIPFIFDMRGFWADERVDGNLWNLRNPLYRMVYNYFKKKEKLFLKNAIHTISLTENGKQEILNWNLKNVSPEKIAVIPCCADLSLFTREKIRPNKIEYWKQKLNIKTKPVITYLGSIGTWYMLKEMLEFFKQLLHFYPEALFLFITHDDAQQIYKQAELLEIAKNNIIIQKASRHEVAELLAISDVSIFFIKPVFSKKASSPTKLGEIMSMGIPVICNSGVGDVAQHVQDGQTGILIPHFNAQEYDAAIKKLPEILKTSAIAMQRTAQHYYNLETGIKKYAEIYYSINSSVKI